MNLIASNYTQASLGRRDFLKTIGSTAVLVSGPLGLSEVFAREKD